MTNGVGFCLARNRRSPKRPPEPRLSGVHPNNAGVEEKKRSRLEVEGMFLGLDKRQAEGAKPGRCAVSVPCAVIPCALKALLFNTRPECFRAGLFWR